MKHSATTIAILFCLCFAACKSARNPILFTDFPDMSMIRVGDTYYMSGTTMHLSPGVPIMKSKDLVNWEIVNYAYRTLADSDEANLRNGKNMYGRGSWASCLRYRDGVFHLSFFAQTTGKTHIYSTTDIEHGSWTEHSFPPSMHDHSLFFDDDGKTYMIYGNGTLRIAELNADLSGVIEGTDSVLIENASTPAGADIMLGAEGSQLFKVNGKYYLFNIVWPSNGMRTVLVHRADRIAGPYEGRVAFRDRGIAQGGLVDTPDGRWYAYLFRDYGAVGRIPYLVPVTWNDGWPVIGVNGKAPESPDLPASVGLIPGIVASDEFTRRSGERDMPLVWQWNHNPDNELWSIAARPGYLRLTTGAVVGDVLSAKNTLTQRTFGPECSATVAIETHMMKDGDYAGLAAFQKFFGTVGVKMDGGKRYVLMEASRNDGISVEHVKIPIDETRIYLRIHCDFNPVDEERRNDTAYFYYSLDGTRWISVGAPLRMYYTMPHFMGYRLSLFNFATETSGGYVDFDYFRINV